MELFILHNVSTQGALLRFDAFPSNVQEIARGTDPMIAEMIRDIGVKGAKVKRWDLSHFRTNYMIDDGADPDDWTQTWLRETQIVVALDRAVKLDVQETELVRTYARDRTWKGKPDLSFPSECVVTANFYRKGQVEKAESRIGSLAKKRGVGAVQFERWWPSQQKLRIHLGAFPKEFFAAGAPWAREVIEICGKLGGTTTWNERTDPEHMKK